MIRGRIVPNVLKHLEPSASDEKVEQARILGVIVEYIQAFYLASDELIDDSTSRREKPVRYKNVQTRSALIVHIINRRSLLRARSLR